MSSVNRTSSVTKRPAFQWYPGDYQRDTALQACSFEARGLWREMLDLMHDGEPYGHLTAGGVAITAEQLARMVGIGAPRAKRYLSELEDRKVFSRTDAGVIFSRRMVRDEHNRNVRAAGGASSLNNPNVPRPKDRAKDGGKDTLPPSLPASLEVSPAVASAVAVAVATKETTPSGERYAFMQPFRDEWKNRYGGEIPLGSAKILAPLVKQHTEDEVLRRFKIYLDATPTQYVSGSLAKFASMFGTYSATSTAPNAEAARIWSLMKTYGFANATRFTIDTDLARAVADGKIPDAEAFKSTLQKLPLIELRDVKSDEAAHKIIAERLAKAAKDELHNKKRGYV